MSVVDASTASPYNGPILASAVGHRSPIQSRGVLQLTLSALIQMVYVGMYGIAVCQSFDYFQWCVDSRPRARLHSPFAD